MQTLEALSKRIETARDLQSVVRTMKTLSSVAIHQYEAAVESLKHYSQTIEDGFQATLPHIEMSTIRSAKSGQLGVVVIGSDQGMCGPFNEKITSLVAQRLPREPMPRIWCLGVRLVPRLIDAGLTVEKHLGLPGSVHGITSAVQKLVIGLEEWRVHAHVDRLWVFFNRRISGASYEPTLLEVLPRPRSWYEELARRPWPTRTLPMLPANPERTLSHLFREYLFVTFFQAIAQSLASENASRIAAMQAAEKNIDERLVALNLQFQQLRQESITAELLDIVTGAQALEDQGS